MPVINNILQDPFDIVIHGEEMRSFALTSNVVTPLAMAPLLEGSCSEPNPLPVIVAGEQNLLTTVGSYPVPNKEVLQDPLIRTNALIATPSGALRADSSWSVYYEYYVRQHSTMVNIWSNERFEWKSVIIKSSSSQPEEHGNRRLGPLCLGRRSFNRVPEANSSRSGHILGLLFLGATVGRPRNPGQHRLGNNHYFRTGSREDASDVLTANFLRLQEGLRSLEEFGKIINPAVGVAIEQLRYQTYTIQRAVDSTRVGQERLAFARLYVLFDGRSSMEEFERMAQGLIPAGVDFLQLRDKRWPIVNWSTVPGGCGD